MILSGIFFSFFSIRGAERKIKRLKLDDKVKTLEKTLKEQEARIPLWRKKIESLTLQYS
jgi:hypothetical protein